MSPSPRSFVSPRGRLYGGRPRLLDLFCGAGGAAMGYHRAGFEVVGVDVKPQPNYPFEFIQGDAISLLNEWVLPSTMSSICSPQFGFMGWLFDAIHASPPCQRWSSKTKDPEAHPDLVTPLRPLLEATGLPYVIENVPGAPLRESIFLCGSQFGLGVRRHRLFETNWPIMAPGLCQHHEKNPNYLLYDHGRWYMSSVVHVFGTGGGKGREHWAEAMGIDWMTDSELTQAIPPAMTEYVGAALMQHIRATPVLASAGKEGAA